MTVPTHTRASHINQPNVGKKAAVKRKHKYFYGILYLSLFMRKVMVKMNAP